MQKLAFVVTPLLAWIILDFSSKVSLYFVKNALEHHGMEAEMEKRVAPLCILKSTFKMPKHHLCHKFQGSRNSIFQELCLKLLGKVEIIK